MSGSAGLVKSFLLEIWWFRSTILMISAPILLSIMLPFYESMGMTVKACNCFYILLLMAIYWCTEVLPLPVTSLLPLVLVPLMGIQTADQVARNYFKDTIVLFLGGLMVAVAVEHSELHKRIALTILRLVGTNPRFLMLGFMIPTWFLSMWISNTATTAMMITIVQAVIKELEVSSAAEEKRKKQSAAGKDTEAQGETIGMTVIDEDSSVEITSGDYSETEPAGQWIKTAKALSLCVAYAASAGGISTLTGTGPNLVLIQNVYKYSEELDGYEFGLNFASWMGFAVPVSLIIFVILWLWLQIIFIGFSDCKNKQTEDEKRIIKQVIQSEYDKLGDVTWKEVMTLAHFVLLAVLWLSRNPGKAGGWGSLFLPKHASDATAAIFIAILLFMVPSSKPDFFCWRESTQERTPKPRTGLLTWNVVTHKLPWGLIILVGGGFALADAILKSGLSEFIGDRLNFMSDWPQWALIMCLCTITAVVTEITSNVAISTFLLPIVGDMALQQGMNPLLTMIPVCLACSLAYMLPVATPPNALVFSTGVLRIKDMVFAGLFMNIAGILVVTAATIFWGDSMFNLTNFNHNVSSIMLNSTTTMSP